MTTLVRLLLPGPVQEDFRPNNVACIESKCQSALQQQNIRYVHAIQKLCCGVQGLQPLVHKLTIVPASTVQILLSIACFGAACYCRC